MHFHYLTYMVTPQHKKPCPGVFFLDRPFLGHHCNILSLSDLCLGVKKKILKGIMHFHYLTYKATPQRKNPYPGGHEIYNLGRPFLVHHYYILSLSDLCLGVKKKIFKGIMHFHSLTYMVTPQHKNPCPGGFFLIDPSLVIIAIYLVCLIYAWEQRRRF